MKEQFINLLKGINRDGINELIEFLEKTDFYTAPASTKFHCAYEGGLLEHSLNVYSALKELTKGEWAEDTIRIVGLLHDICKVNQYKVEMRNKKNEHGEWVKEPYYATDDIMPLGHGEKSVMLLQYKGLKLNLIEIMMIRNHMSAFRDNQYLNDVSHRFSKCPQSLILHFADMLSTYTNESNDLQKRLTASHS